MTTVLVARHGSTPADESDPPRFKGWWDVGLSASGLAQAHQLAEELVARTIDRIVASDLRRSRELADQLGAHLGVPVALDPRLREQGLGSWEGRTLAEIELDDPESVVRWRTDPLSVPGREPRADFVERVRRFVADELWRNHHDRLLVVTHANVIAVLLMLTTASPLEAVRDLVPAVGRYIELEVSADGVHS